MALSFFVPGVPVPQGSKTLSRHGVMYEANKKLKPWRETVRQHAVRAHGGQEPLDTAVKVTAVFYMPQPKRTRFGRYPAGKPDADKLARAVGDALTAAGVIKDDARVVTWDIRKRWSHGRPGARIVVQKEAFAT